MCVTGHPVLRAACQITRLQYIATLKVLWFLRCGDLHFGFARVRCPDCPLTTTQILRHCGLWERPLRTLASARWLPGRTSQLPDEPRDLELVLDSEFAAAKAVQSETHQPQVER